MDTTRTIESRINLLSLPGIALTAFLVVFTILFPFGLAAGFAFTHGMSVITSLIAGAGTVLWVWAWLYWSE